METFWWHSSTKEQHLYLQEQVLFKSWPEEYHIEIKKLNEAKQRDVNKNETSKIISSYP